MKPLLPGALYQEGASQTSMPSSLMLTVLGLITQVPRRVFGYAKRTSFRICTHGAIRECRHSFGAMDFIGTV
jgi:hypothetical protein